MKGLVLVLLMVAACPVQSAKHKTGTLIKGAVAKSYMTNGLLDIWGNICAFPHI
jgi:hypothetical protein